MTMFRNFQPLQSADRGHSPHMGLALDTPRGLFSGTENNRYLVCDGVEMRFAIVLDHQTIQPFTRIALGCQPIDHGSLCGQGVIHLDEPVIDQEEFPEDGNLLVRNGSVGMFVTDECGWGSWHTVLIGKSNASEGIYDVWTFIDIWGDWFFASNNRFNPQAITN